MGPFAQSQWPSWGYTGVSDPFSTYSQVPNSYAYLAESMEAYQAHHSRIINQQMSRTTESKPRLSKEEVEVLEAEFQKNHKPNSTTKKGLAESMHVDNARINNWFQNRRAREKKEKNIREYEARQKLEKQKANGEDMNAGEERKRDLVGSSAPFPEPGKVAMSDTSSASSPEDSAADASEPSLAVKTEDGITMPSSIETTPDLLSETSNFIKVDPDRAGNDDESTHQSPDDIPDYLSINGDSIALSDTEMYIAMGDKTPDQLFAGYQGLDAQSGVAKANEFFSSQLFLGNQGQYHGLSPADSDLSISPMSQVCADSQLKSPPPIDIASRRNRRPTPISTLGSRNYSSTVPKSAMDFGRKADVAGFMRRTSSASGSGRICKSVSTPRNMLSLRRSPSTSGKSGSAAPPTPNTPIVTAQQAARDMPAPSAFPLDGKYVIPHDPTLTTPPTTPGIVDGLFQMGNAYGLAVGDGSIVGMNMSSAPNGFNLGGMVQNNQGFFSASGEQDGLFTSPSSSGYLGFYGNQSDYNWSEIDSLQN